MPAISVRGAIPDHSDRTAPHSRRIQLGSPDGSLARRLLSAPALKGIRSFTAERSKRLVVLPVRVRLWT